MKKRIWSIVFAVISVMILCMLPARKAMAADPYVKISNNNLPKGKYMNINYEVGTDKPDDGRYAYFDGSTLTLNNFDASYAGDDATIYMHHVANLIFHGTNNISSSVDYGIALSSNPNLNINGDGVLNVDSTGFESQGFAGDSITINSGNVNAQGSKAIGVSTLKVLGGTVSAVGTGLTGIGCEEIHGISITGGTLYATGNWCAACIFPATSNALVKGSLSYNAAKDTLGAVIWAQTGTDPVYSYYYPNYLIGTVAAKTLYIDATSHASGTICDHNYEWMVENEPTEYETGLLVEKCTKCGNIRSSQVIPAIKDDYGRCMYERTKQILRAKSGQTITVDIGYWDSLPKSFFEALANKRDITVKVKFMYKGKHYEFMIAPGQTIDTSLDYYGPEKLIQLYSATIVNTK